MVMSSPGSRLGLETGPGLATLRLGRGEGILGTGEGDGQEMESEESSISSVRHSNLVGVKHQLTGAWCIIPLGRSSQCWVVSWELLGHWLSGVHLRV